MARPLVLVTYDADPATRAVFKATLGTIADLAYLTDAAQVNRGTLLERAEAVVTWSPARDLRREEFRRLTRARFVQLLTVGVDHVPFDWLPAGAIVAKNAGAFSTAIAEHTVAMALAAAKRLIPQHAKLVAGEFDMMSRNRVLAGGTCALIGYGSLGRAIARLMRGLGLEIVAINRSGTTVDPVAFVGTLVDLEPALTRADVIVVALPLTPATRGLFGARELGWMKDDAILVNIARAHVVDEDALYARLVRTPTFQACLDVWWVEPYRDGVFRMKHPFLELPNVLGSPHNSSVVAGGLEEAVQLGADNVRRFLATGAYDYLVPDDERLPLAV
ncbi:MAG: hydroxyacid dehydrogenase [Alphaproteobacteria bacterium]|nr:hydroxyacid dehydrogenase [Alphaproteobacteria bacterium]